jgi:hypothetical protein
VSDALKPLAAATAIAATAAMANAVATASAPAASLPPALANLTVGNMLAGIVIERGRGSVLLKTDKGLISLLTNMALKLGAEVMLEVQSAGAQLRFAILSVDRRPPGLAAGEAAQGTPPSQLMPPSGRGDGSAPPLPATTARSPLAGRIVMADIIAPPETGSRPSGADPIPTLLRRMEALAATFAIPTVDGAAGAATAEPLPVIPTTEALERILTAIAPSSPETVEVLLGPAPDKPAPMAPLPATDGESGPEEHLVANAAPIHQSPTGAAESRAPEMAAAETPVSTAALENPSGAAQTHAPALAAAVGNSSAAADATPVSPPPKPIAIRLIDVLAPLPDGGARSPAIRSPQAGGDSIVLLGTVVGGDSKSVDLATPIGTLRLPVAGGPAIGSQIAFEMVAPPQREARMAPEESPASPTGALPQRTLAADPPKDWPALRDAIAALPPESDAGAALVPRPGAMLGPALLTFLAGLRAGGSAKAWLGATATDALESTGRARLIERLGEEISTRATAASQIDSDGWQTMAVPILFGARIEEVRFHVHTRRNGKDGGDAGSRFVVEATLSALGPLQLDGLVRSSRFDLIVRTARPLPETMRRDIETLFAKSLSATTYRGGVSFRGDATAQASLGRLQAPRGAGVVV